MQTVLKIAVFLTFSACALGRPHVELGLSHKLKQGECVQYSDLSVCYRGVCRFKNSNKDTNYGLLFQVDDVETKPILAGYRTNGDIGSPIIIIGAARKFNLDGRDFYLWAALPASYSFTPVPPVLEPEITIWTYEPSGLNYRFDLVTEPELDNKCLDFVDFYECLSLCDEHGEGDGIGGGCYHLCPASLESLRKKYGN